MMAAAVVVAVAMTGCRTIDPGADPLLVRAQQTYLTSRDTFNLVFSVEDKTQEYLEAKVPGTHAAVERLRGEAKIYLPSVLAMIDAYRRGESGDRLQQMLGVVDQAILEAQRVLTPPAALRAGIGVPEVLAILAAARDLITWIQSQTATLPTGGWTAEQRAAVDAAWSQLTASRAWLTDSEGGGAPLARAN